MTSKSTSFSIMTIYDDLVRYTNMLIDGSSDKDFLQFVVYQEETRHKFLNCIQECELLNIQLKKANDQLNDSDRKLAHARRLLDEEKKRRHAAEIQRNAFEKQIFMVRKLLFNDNGKDVNEETRQKFEFLNNSTLNKRMDNINLNDNHNKDTLNTITTLNSSQSLMSDSSWFSHMGEDLELSALLNQNHQNREWKEHQPSESYSAKKQNSSHKINNFDNSNDIIAMSKLVVPKKEPIITTSTMKSLSDYEINDLQTRRLDPQTWHHQNDQQNILKKEKAESNKHLFNSELPPPSQDINFSSESDSESTFKPSPNIGGYILNTKMIRGHNFNGKSVIKPESCLPCGKRIRFGKLVLKCRDCKAIAHTECKDLLPLPCVPAGNTPTVRGASGTIADYTPMIPPMVPSLVVHCVNEIELRGLSEQGLYRVNGGISEVKCLKDKFLKGKGAPTLSDIDIATICSTLKDFLRSLREPLITVGLWADFVRAATISDKQDADAAIFQAISELPQPNRDTLAFLILHLQKVSSTPECQMPIDNIARVFGPTLVGYSCIEPSATSMLSETSSQVAIVGSLLKIPSDYWANFVNADVLYDMETSKTRKLNYTPLSESLLKRRTSRRFFNTPLVSSRAFSRKNKKYFITTAPFNV